ncbi:MAG: GNAT family N-acetyltransferase [Blastochloris sp.]|nr:GNAT family N-acetyltransferase [Blastochloris sp.]
MFRPEWIKFTWDLTKLPSEGNKLGPNLEIRSGQPAEKDKIWTAIERSYQAEQGWGIILPDRLKELKDLTYKGLEEGFLEVLVLEDGKRIVGASGLVASPECPRQLATGVCITEEYRCRGLGEELLYQSLKFLAGKKLEHAAVVTRSNVAAHKYLYPKFGSHRDKMEKLPEVEPVKAK